MALNCRADLPVACPLSGEYQTPLFKMVAAAFDPERTSSLICLLGYAEFRVCFGFPDPLLCTVRYWSLSIPLKSKWSLLKWVAPF
jgi:hypothetical protein